MSLARFAVGVALAAVVLASPAAADDVRPIQIQIREREPNAFLVQWRVPKLLPIQAMPQPVLPVECVPEGERVLLDQQATWINQQAYRCEGGLAGRAVGIHYPIRDPQLTTVVRVELLSGERFAHAFAPAEESWLVPNVEAGSVAAWLDGAASAVLAGARHMVGNWAHLAFLLAISLLGGALGAARLATGFAIGQLGAVAVAAVLGPADPLLPEVLAAIAVALLAREALRASAPVARLVGLSAAGGLFHGVSLSSVLPTADATWSLLLLLVLGMDAVLLALALAVSWSARVIARRWQPTWTRAALAYAAGTTAVATAAVLALEPPQLEVPLQDDGARLPGIGAMAGAGSATPGSRRLAPQVSDAPVQSFLAIEPFELRHEVLVRLAALAEVAGVTSDQLVLAVEDQDSVAARIGAYVSSRIGVTIDGVAAAGTLDRIDYLTVDPLGVLPRQAPVAEPVDEAMVGVTIVHLVPGVPDSVTLSWNEFSDAVPSVPATVIDPESSGSVMLRPDAATVRWENTLLENPIPTVSSVAVEPPTVPAPLLSLPIVLATLALGVIAARGHRRPLALAGARVTLAATFVVAPVAQVAVPVPFGIGSVPSERAARRILAGVLPNVYRAFEFRDEATVYDRLALTVTGESLTNAYLEHRRALVMEERGGARARVDAVEVVGVDDIRPVDGGGFEGRAVWTVGGTVTHFGHRHFRQNRYDARVALESVAGNWKIGTIEVLEEERLK